MTLEEWSAWILLAICLPAGTVGIYGLISDYRDWKKIKRKKGWECGLY
jgi:hypothetical protein